MLRKLSELFPKNKRMLEVDLRESRKEKELLSNYLHSRLKVEVVSSSNRLMVESEDLSLDDLKRAVNKFVYRQKLMNQYWVTLESNVVKINKFEMSDKNEKRKKSGTPPSTIKHGW